MRYYSVILININAGLIEIWDIGTPCTKRDAQRYAKNQAFAKHFCFVSEDCNPGNYTDDQHDTWLATIRQEIHESTQNPIVCKHRVS